jgi:hypothetical protein
MVNEPLKNPQTWPLSDSFNVETFSIDLRDRLQADGGFDDQG